MKKAIILARVSTPEQQKTGLSIDDIQLPQLRDYAKEHNIEIVKEFVFQETAGQKLRKKFDEMVQFIKDSPEIKVVIGFRVDRLTRNYRDAVEMDKLRIDYDKELHFVNDRLVLNGKSVGRDIQDWDLKVFLAKQHINRCQEDAQNTLDMKLRNQEMYGRAPFGYENYKDDNHKSSARPKPFEAGIVKQIFDWYSSGAYSYLQISKKVSEDFKIKMYKSMVEKILKRRFYYGEREFNGEISKHKCPRIVSKEVWELCEGIRNGRGLTKHTGKFEGKHGIYRGLIYCKDCGCSMTSELHTKTQKNGNVHNWIYYHCTGSKGKHKGTWIEEKEVTNQFAKLLKHMKVPKADLEHMVSTLSDSHKGKIKFNDEMFDEYNNQIKKYERMIENAYEDKCSSSITQEEYDKHRKNWRSKQDEYRDKLSKLQHADEEYYMNASLLLELASRSYELFLGSEPDEKREIIQLVFQNLFLNQGKLEYTMNKPFDSIFKTAGSLTWGPFWDEFRNFITQMLRSDSPDDFL